jgi:uncharacterized protein (TIGR02001 family)
MNMTKLNKCTALLAALTVLGAAHLNAQASANIAATSNYVWRGATQTDDSAAIQGGLDYADESGFYIGTWASNVDFGGGGEVELDVYGGFGGEVEGFGYDIGLIGYLYPDSDDANFYEIALGGSYQIFSFGVNYTVASDVSDAAGSAEAFIEGDLYFYAGLGFDLGEGWGLGLTAGSYNFEDDGVAGADLDYTHFQADISKSTEDYGTFTFSVSIAGDEANGGDDDPKVFVSWATEF